MWGSRCACQDVDAENRAVEWIGAGSVDVVGLAGLVIAVAALAASFVIYRWQRQRKSLGCAVITNRPLLAFQSPFAVSVHHAGRLVDKPRLVVMRVANTGSLPIEVGDYERQIAIMFAGCDVLSVEVTGVHPAELRPILSIKGDAITMEPCLLNPGDVIELQILLDGASATPQTNCRTVGVQSANAIKVPRDSWGKAWRVTAIEAVTSTSAGLLPLAVGAWLGVRPGGVTGITVAGIFGLLAGLSCWYALSTYRRGRILRALPLPEGH